MVTAVTASRTTSLFTDNDNDGEPDPGDTLLTRIQINNIGAEEALALMVSDNFTGSTLVPGSITVTPVAYDDSYGLTGNTPITFNALQGVLANDKDADSATPFSNVGVTVTQVNGTNIGGTMNVANGTVAMNADGSFTFTPTTGFVGVTSFQYTIQDAQGLNNITTGVVTLTVTGKVWYVDSAYTGVNGASDGSFNKPFTTLANLNGLTGDGTTNDDVDGSGDSIFVYNRGTAYTGGITLEASQTLLGDGQDFLVNNMQIGAPGELNNATINNAGLNGGITLSTDNTIKGLTVNGTNANAIGIQDGNSSVGNLVIDKVSLTGTGQAVDIDQGGNLNVDIDTLSSSGAGTNMQGVQLAGTASSGAGLLQGTFNAANGTIQTSSDHGFQIGTGGGALGGGTLAVTYGGNISTSLNGSAVHISGRLAGSGDINFNGTIFQDSGASSTSDGIAITTVAAGNINFTGTKTIDTTGTNLNAVSVTANSGAIINFSGGAFNIDTSNGNGFAISQSGGSVNVSTAADVDATGTGRGLSITGSTGGTVNFTGGGLTITTSSGTALHDNNVSEGSVLNISGAGNTLATTGGGALVDIANVDTTGLTFDTLNASSSVTNNNAININNLDGGTWTSNTITVTGTTGATSDGLKIQGGSSTVFNLGTVTVSNTGDDGIEINGANNGAVTISSINVQNTAGQGVEINAATAAVTITAGAIGSTNDSTLEGVLVTGGNGNVTVGATVTKTTVGNVVEVTGHTGGAVSFTNTISATGGVDNGILLTQNTGGTIGFGGNVTLNTGASNAFTFTNTLGTGAAVTLNGGNLDIDTTTGRAIEATNTTLTAGSLTISGANNVIDHTGATGRAINIDGVTSNVTLLSVDAAATNSTVIYVRNNGTLGSFQLTGTGSTAGSGGVFNGVTGGDGDNQSGIGIYLENANNVVLQNLTLSGNYQNFGIRGQNVNNFTLRDSSLQGTYGSTNAGPGAEAAIRFGTQGGATGLTGTALLEGNVIQGGFADNLAVYTYGANTLNLTIKDSANDQAIFNANASGTGNDNVHIESGNTANVTIMVDGVQFTGANGDQLQVTVTDNVVQNLTIQNSTFTQSDATSLGGGLKIDAGGAGNYNSTYLIHNNTIKGATSTAIDTRVGGTNGTVSGVITNNTVGTNGGGFQSGLADVGSTQGFGIWTGIDKTNGGTVNYAVRIQGNTIRDIGGVSGGGIVVTSAAGGNAGNARVEATITSNTVSEMGPLSLTGLYAQMGGSGPTDNARMGLNISSNTFTAPSTAGGSNAVVLDQVNAVSHFYLPGYAGSPNGEGFGGTASANVGTYLVGKGNILTNGPAPNFPGSGVDAVTVQGLGGEAFTLAVPILLAPQAPQDWEATLAEYLAELEAANAAAGVDQTSGQGGETGVPADDGGDPTLPAGDPGTGSTPTGGGGNSTPPVVADDGILTQGELDQLVEAAIQRWADAGASEDQLAAMRATSVTVSEMAGLYIGASSAGQIQIDSDGAGYGWFVDSTPGEDSEFDGSGNKLTADQGGAAEGKIDLLTVIMHELGHQIGIEDSYQPGDDAELMYGYLNPGERRLPGDDDHEGAVPGSVDFTAYALAPVAAGGLPVGKSVEVAWKSLVDVFSNESIPTFNNTGTVSGSNFPTVNTNTEQLNVDSLTLGDLIFNDVNKDGNYDVGTDTGVVGVTLTLYADTNGNGALDGAELTNVIATATTGAGGVYVFDNLAPGDYVVSIDASNFAPAAVLFNKVSIAGGTDPDDNVDGDDNGIAGPGGTIISAPIRLDYNMEPTAGTGNDTNNTLDFGFITPNQEPVSTNLEGDIATYVEGAAPVKLDNGGNATLSDDNANFNGGTLTVAIGTGAVAAEDVLSIGTTAAVTLGAGSTVLVNGTTVGTYAGGSNGNALVITMNTNATAARMQEVLRALQYNNTNLINPNTDTRAVSITLVDGGGTDGGLGDDTLVINSLVNITPVNDEPSGADNNDTVVDDQILVFDAANFSTGFTDQDGNTFAGVKITTLPPALSGILYFDADGPGGTPPVAVVAGNTISAADLAAGKLTFDPAPATGGTSPTFTFQVQDNGGNLNGGVEFDQSPNTFTINITPSDIAPVVDLNGTNDAGNDYASAYTEGGTAAAVADTDVTITDADAGDQVEGATITITDAIAGDQLTIVGPLPGLIMASGEGTATITLSGTGTQAQYQTALTQIRYSSTSDNPTAAGTDGSRSVTVTVTDGDLPSVARTTTVTVTGVNDAPVNTVGGVAFTDEDTSVVLTGVSVSDPDVDPATTPISVTLSVDNGTLDIREDVAGGITGANIVAGANGSDTISIIATQNQINATLANATGLTYTPDTDFNGTDGLQVITNDLGASGTDPGNTGTGSSEQDDDTKTINVASVNDAPSGTSSTQTLVEDTTHTFATADFGFTDPSDGDSFDSVLFASAPTGGKLYIDTDGAGGNAPVELTYPTNVPVSEISAGHLTFVPTANLNGSGAASVSFQVVDDGDTVAPSENTDQSANTLTFDITAVNDPPAGTDATITADEDAFRVLTQADFGFTDPDAGDAMSAVTITGVTGGQLYYDADGTGGGGAPVAVGSFPQTYTVAELAAGNVSWKANANLNGNGVGTIGFQVADNSGQANNTDPSANTLSVNVNPFNDQPNIPNSPTIAAVEQVPIKINPAITVSDVDLDARNGGAGDYSGAAFAINRTVSNAEDLFSFDTVGALFTVNGSNLESGGNVIATLAQSGGILNINFVNNGTVPTTALVNDVLQHLQYTNTADSPPASVTLIYIIDDGAPGGGQGTVVGGNDIDGGQVTINITDTEEPPILDLNGAGAGTSTTVGYTEDTTLTPIAPAGTVSDLDSPDFDTGVLTVTITAGGSADDRLAIADQGTGQGQIQVSSPDIYYRPIGAPPAGTVVIGTFFGGTDGSTPLVITLNANANQEAVQALLRAIGYFNIGEDPGTTRTVSFSMTDGDGNTSDPALATINITGIDDPATAVDDFVATNEDAVLNGNVFADNGGGGPDEDADDPLEVTHVNGSAIAVGQQITLTSGAKLTLNDNGNFTYDPNDKFNTLTSTASGQTGAVNTSAPDSFTYTIAGGDTATVTVTVNGVVSPEDQLWGDGGNNTITGTPGPDFFFVPQGGNDTLSGLGGNDVFYFGNAFTNADAVDGGPGNDVVALQGDYTVTLSANDLVNVETLTVLTSQDPRFGGAGTDFDYNITTVEENVVAGQTLIVNASTLLAGEDLTFNGSAETNGAFFIYAGQGTDTLIGGSQADVFFFAEPQRFSAGDTVNGGGGNDIVVLRGDYTVSFGATAFTSVETITLMTAADTRFAQLGAEYDYNVTLSNGNVLAGATLTVNGGKLGATETMVVDGSAETDGHYRMFGGSADDSLTGGTGNDLLYGGLGKDYLKGGAGVDTYQYKAPAESTGTSHDTIDGFDYNVDKLDLLGTHDTYSSLNGGTVNFASFDADMTAAMAGVLDSSEAVFFSVTGGDQAGKIFLVIDQNGTAGYQSGEDFVIDVTASSPPPGPIYPDFIV